jgi:hypothetical protein
MNTELIGMIGAYTVIAFVLSGLAMTLYWEKEAVQRFAIELRAVMQGKDAARRRKRLVLIAAAVGVLWSGGMMYMATANAPDDPPATEESP